MYDKLIEKLRDDSILENCEFDFVHKYMHEAADAIEELEKQLDEEAEYATALACNVPHWIPVTERLPDVGKDVLCFCRANICLVLSRDGNLWREGADRYYMSGFVTHWMPLPQPPESEGEG